MQTVPAIPFEALVVGAICCGSALLAVGGLAVAFVLSRRPPGPDDSTPAG